MYFGTYRTYEQPCSVGPARKRSSLPAPSLQSWTVLCSNYALSNGQVSKKYYTALPRGVSNGISRTHLRYQSYFPYKGFLDCCKIMMDEFPFSHFLSNKLEH